MKIVKMAGGLGSQMMAYGLACALSKKYEENCILDCSIYNYEIHHNGYELKKIFGINEKNISNYLNFILNSSLFPVRVFRKFLRLLNIIKFHDAETCKYNFDPKVFTKTGNVIYRQCWTSYKYFLDVESEIKSIYTFPTIDARNKEIKSKIESTNSVALHIRRGDYLKNALLGDLAPESYYTMAIEYILKNVKDPVFFIFSNDIEWCKKNIHVENKYFIDWNDGENAFRDMQLMSLCKHNIIPNSSFSWWGAYLNNNPSKIVVAPERWINPSQYHEMNDMNLPEWHVIKNY